MTGLMKGHAEQYLQLRRDLGYELDRPGRPVRQFADQCDVPGITVITWQAAVERAQRTGQASAWYQWMRFSAVRGFAIYLHALDPAHQIPPAGLLPSRQDRPAPRLLSDGDIAALIRAAGALRPAVHAATCQALIGLAAVTGIRPCEVIRMNEQDIDPAALIMTVHGKNHKDRQVLLHPTTAAALARYARLRDQALPRRDGPAFFVNARGTQMTAGRTAEVFAGLAGRAGAGAAGPGRRRPVLNSLRHSFAVTTLIGWLEAGMNVEASLPALSAWTGHQKPRSAHWYLQAVPELMQAASDHMIRAAARDPRRGEPQGERS